MLEITTRTFEVDSNLFLELRPITRELLDRAILRAGQRFYAFTTGEEWAVEALKKFPPSYREVLLSHEGLVRMAWLHVPVELLTQSIVTCRNADGESVAKPAPFVLARALTEPATAMRFRAAVGPDLFALDIAGLELAHV